MTDTEASTASKADAGAESTSTGTAPVFGSNFGTQGGFAGFTGVAPPKKDADGEEANGEDAEEECKAEFTPLVQLEEVEVNTGEEDEECLLELKCKMYRYDKDGKEWKERGIGQAKFLRNKESKKTRFLMRQEKTLKIRANHIIMPGTNITSHGGNEKAWVWTAMDFADEEQRIEMLAIRLGSVEKATEFKKQYEKSMDENAPLLGDAQPADIKEDDQAAQKAEQDKKTGADADALADKVAETKV